MPPLILVAPYQLKAVVATLLKIYSTWSTSGGSYGALSNSNLTLATSSGSLRGGISEIGVTTGKHYWEVLIDNLSSFGMIGIGTQTANNASTPYNVGEAVLCFGNSFYGGAGTVTAGSNFTIATGMRLGFALDADGRTISIYANGVFKATLSFVLPLASKIYALACDGDNGTSAVFTANFGATAFSYPVPSGYNSGLYNAVAGPQFVASSNADYMNSNLVLTKPVEVQAGDLMVIILTCTTSTFNAPSGWSLQKDFTWPSYSYSSRVYTKIATANEPASYVFDQTASVLESLGVLLVYRNATGISVMKDFKESMQTYSFDPLTTLQNDSLVVTYACDRSPTIPTTPSGQTSRNSRMGTYLGARVADKMYSVAGTLVSPVSTGGTTYNGAYVTFALR